MKRIFFTLSIIVILFIIYLAILNQDATVDINYLKGYLYTMDSENLYVSKAIGLSKYTLILFFSGVITGAGIVSLFLGVQTEKAKAYKRELEKNSITGIANASKVEVLEAKIKTLEKAFTSVVDERTKLEIQIKDLNAEIEAMNKNKN